MELRGKRAIALITVLLATVVLAMLSSSLVVLARQGLTSGEWMRRRETVTAAAHSGLDYAKTRLIQNSNWARAAFGSTTVIDDAQLRVVESGSDPNSNQVDGLLKDTGATFTLRVVNSLKVRARQTAPAWSKTGVRVPAGCALVQVRATYEGQAKTFEVTLRRDSPLTHAVDASGDFAVEWGGGSSNNVTFRSRIPRGNALRAGRSIHLPDFGQGGVQFVGSRGSMQSGNDTTVNTTLSFDSAGNVLGNLTGQGLDGNTGLADATSNTTNANIQVGTPASPRRFDASQLQAPADPVKILAAGEYVFTGPETVRHATSNMTYEGAINGTVVLSNFRFIPQGNVEVNGELVIRGEVNRRSVVNGIYSVANETSAVPVSLGLGYTSTGLPKAAGEGKDRLTVNGAVSVQGDLVGNGQLFVNEAGPLAGNLTVNGNSFLSSTRTDGMAVVADGQIAFRDVSAGQELMPFAMKNDDVGYLNTAVQLEAAANAASNTVFSDLHSSNATQRSSMAGSSDDGTTGLRNQPILDRGHYLNTSVANMTTTPGGLDVSMVNVTHNNTTVSASNAICSYISGSATNVTLGEHLRVREFVKSLDFGIPKEYLIDRNHAAYRNNSSSNTTGDKRDSDGDITQLIINQLQAYDQDARNREQDLLTYLSNAAVDDPYVEPARSDLIFGGLMFSNKNIYTNVSRQFRLFGSMMANGTIGFDQLFRATFMFDSSLTEDQFDLSKIGLVPVLFWCD
jgi:hypothetical protein